MHFNETEDFFTPKEIILPMDNFYSAECNSEGFFRMNRMSRRDKIRRFDFQVRFRFLSRIFPKHEASFLYFAMLQKISQQARQQPMPTPKSCGLELEADLDFEYKSVYSQCSNINNQGIYLQVKHRGLV